MKVNTKQIIYTLLVIVCCISYTNAQGRNDHRPNDRERPTPPSYEELLQKMDVNKDGKLAKDEAKGPLSKDFKQVDTNGDGFITKEELENGKPNHKRRKPKNKNDLNVTTVFKEMDTDKDKKIAKSEAKGIVAERFEEFDLDNDGYISKNEMGKALRKINNDN